MILPIGRLIISEKSPIQNHLRRNPDAADSEIFGPGLGALDPIRRRHFLRNPATATGVHITIACGLVQDDASCLMAISSGRCCWALTKAMDPPSTYSTYARY